MDKRAVAAVGNIGFDINSIALLIDGRNTAYRAIYANRGDNGPRYHSLIVMLRFINTWLERFEPLDVHVFWDSPKQTLWRRKILETYKDRPPSPHRDDISVELDDTQTAAQKILAHMNVRQYHLPRMEADDLIFAACRVLHDRPCVVVSSDGDFHQLVFHCRNVIVYEPRKDKIIEVDTLADPVIQKALMGDVSDTIDGYAGIGPVKSKAMAKSLHNRVAFLRQVGTDKYLRNMLLVDLSLCPYLSSNKLYVERILAEDTKFNKQEISNISSECKIHGLHQEYERIVAPFKYLGRKPDEHYCCPDCNKGQFKCSSGWSCENGHGYGMPTIRTTD